MSPDAVLATYHETLTDKGRADRRAWADRVLAQRRNALRNLGQYEFEMQAGQAYADCGLRSGLIAAGAAVTIPTEGLRQGEQMAFYRDHRYA